MKLDSKLFDRIRIRPRHYEEPRSEVPRCAWEGCDRPGLYRAPKGHRSIGEYHNFCLDHVRHYNTAYNFFAGMSQPDIESHVNRSPAMDWGLGLDDKAGPQQRRAPPRPRATGRHRFSDPLNLFARLARFNRGRGETQEPTRPLAEPDRRALESLGITGPARSDEIKRAYKTLVKIHHPDANGGSKSSEDRLRSIIAAYTHLKIRGFVSR
ncbi:MAG TPA: DnaJ domain-containing protein [Reyranella sp.]|nr:DnaJ domain-containing protein [Reyranella sp.]